MISKKIWYIIAGICLLSLIVGTASAVTVAFDKTEYRVNDTAKVTVTGAADGTVFSINLTTYNQVAPDQKFSYQTGNISIPFSVAVRDATATASSENSTYNTITVGRWNNVGVYEEFTRSDPSANRTFKRSTTYQSMDGGIFFGRWAGTAAPGSSKVTSTFQFTGTKASGPADFTLTANAVSAPSATGYLEVRAGDAVAYAGWISMVTSTTTASPTSEGGSGSDDSGGSGSVTTGTTSSGSGSGSASGTTVTTVAGGTNTTTTVTATNSSAGATTVATTTAKPAGMPFAFIVVLGIGVAALLACRRR
ncbi:MAG: hypothetical protein ABFC38_03125 [Methanospirillum sp.]